MLINCCQKIWSAGVSLKNIIIFFWQIHHSHSGAWLILVGFINDGKIYFSKYSRQREILIWKVELRIFLLVSLNVILSFTMMKKKITRNNFLLIKRRCLLCAVMLKKILWEISSILLDFFEISLGLCPAAYLAWLAWNGLFWPVEWMAGFQSSLKKFFDNFSCQEMGLKKFFIKKSQQPVRFIY